MRGRSLEQAGKDAAIAAQRAAIAGAIAGWTQRRTIFLGMLETTQFGKYSKCGSWFHDLSDRWSFAGLGPQNVYLSGRADGWTDGRAEIYKYSVGNICIFQGIRSNFAKVLPSRRWCGQRPSQLLVRYHNFLVHASQRNIFNCKCTASHILQKCKFCASKVSIRWTQISKKTLTASALFEKVQLQISSRTLTASALLSGTFYLSRNL